MLYVSIHKSYITSYVEQEGSMYSLTYSEKIPHSIVSINIISYLGKDNKARVNKKEHMDSDLPIVPLRGQHVLCTCSIGLYISGWAVSPIFLLSCREKCEVSLISEESHRLLAHL